MSDIIPRSEWASHKPSGLSRISGAVGDLFVHHAADGGPKGGAAATKSAEAVYLRNVEAYHVNTRRYKAVAYSFIIMPSGRIYEGRGWGIVGGHTYNHNATSYGFCFAGNFETQKPTTAALDSARWLLALGKANGHFKSDTRVRGHRDVGAQGGGTACPGRNLYEKLPYIRTPLVRYTKRFKVNGENPRRLLPALARTRALLKKHQPGETVSIMVVRKRA